MTRTFYTYRHPNARYLHFWLRHGQTNQSTATITITAGSGTPTVVDIAEPLSRTGELEIIAPWGASDSGYCAVKIDGADVGFGDVIGWELARTTLDIADGDLAIEPFDTTIPLGGLREGRRIVESDRAGISGVIARSEDAWDYGIRQAIGWWDYEAREVDSTSWTCPFDDDMTFRHRARLKDGTSSTRDYRVYAFTWCDAGTTFRWRMTAQNPVAADDTVTSGSLTHTAGDWTGSPVTGLAIDALGDAELLFEMRRTGGSGSCYVLALSVPEEKV
jgi:hypothetical protein